jgi:hypothetical protein
MPFANTAVAGSTPQDWLGAHYPQLADECDRIPALANTIADLLAAIEAHAEHYGIDPSRYRPSATVMLDGRVMVDLGAPNA